MVKVLGEFESSSSSKIYEVRLGDDEITYCTCLGWRFIKARKEDRACSHMKKMGLRGDSHLTGLTQRTQPKTPATALPTRVPTSTLSQSEIRAAEEKAKREKKGAETKARMKKVPYEFMLSHKYREQDWRASSEYVLEIKHDGALTMFADGQLFTRKGHDITHRFPELDLNLEGVIIGELAVVDTGTGLTVFKRLLTRNTDDKLKIQNAAAQNPVVFYVFDMLRLPNGTDISGLPFAERRRHLEEHIAAYKPAGWMLVEQMPVASPQEVTAALAKARDLNLEGLMLKPLNGRYLAGKRTREWMKVKVWFDGIFEILSHGPTGVGDGYRITIDNNGIEQDVNCGSYQMREELASGKTFKADIQYQKIDDESGRLRFPTLKRLAK